MAHITGEDRSQLLLLPDTVDDYVGPDNPVRFIDAFVDGLDLEAAGFQRVRPNDKGRPGYDPADLLKLYIYGYLNRIRSSRRLETETHRNLEAIWLLRQLKPDFKTIADFRRDNRHAFRAVFRRFVRLCRELDLYGRELIAVAFPSHSNTSRHRKGWQPRVICVATGPSSCLPFGVAGSAIHDLDFSHSLGRFCDR